MPVFNSKNVRHSFLQKSGDVDPGLKTQPEGQTLSKISVLEVVDSGKQKCPPSFASANKVITRTSTWRC